MSQIIPIYIPTYISSVDYQPARVLPRLLYYNGAVQCEPYWVDDLDSTAVQVNQFPYFDNYNVSGSQFPTTGSKSLLFFNEESVYGSTPTGSLYTEYWSDYVELLYNPRTRLLNASAIIPLADYFDMELNDLVEFRGNYYHLRAINEYNLKNGECKIQLLGPILPQALPFAEDAVPVVPTTTTTTTTSTTTTTTTSTTTTTTTTTTTAAPSATLEWFFNESNGAFGYMDLYVNGNIVESRSNTASGTYTVYEGDTINCEVYADICNAPNNYSNVYTTGIITDANCAPDSPVSIFTAVYTVQAGDIGNTLTLAMFSSCDGGCI